MHLWWSGLTRYVQVVVLIRGRRFESCRVHSFVPVRDTPPWLSWQSARLLTDRSLVRAQVEALFFSGVRVRKLLDRSDPDALMRFDSFSSLDLFRVV